MFNPAPRKEKKEGCEKEIGEFEDKISRFYNFKIFTHKNPDGDAIGSSLALKKILEIQNKKADIFIFDSIDEHFNFLPGIKKIRIEKKIEFPPDDDCLIIFLDCSSPSRTGFDALPFKGKENAVIDHHISGNWEDKNAIMLIDTVASSTAEIIFRLSEKLKWKMDHDIFFCLLAGIISDTGTFQHSNTSPDVLKITSRLVKSGFNLKKISDNLYKKKKTESSLKIWGKILARAAVDKKTKMAYSYISQSDLKKYGTGEDELGGLVNLLSGIPESDFSLLLIENKFGNTKASLRSESYKKIDVAKIAKAFGGGGHKLAAGFEVEGTIEDNIELIKKTITEELFKSAAA